MAKRERKTAAPAPEPAEESAPETAAAEAPAPKAKAKVLPVLGKHWLIEGSSTPVDLPDPEDGPYPRRITLNKANYEHVGDAVGVADDGKTPAVIWVYRRM